ncbi:MAG TPA: glycosyltransferase family 4 protein [Solirubrobacteraceae bacterium]|jgi:glycosyltransferase involved in cell wall biosynthesis
MALDVLAVAMLPHVVEGRRGFQYGGCIHNEALLAGLADAGHRVRAVAEAPRDGAARAPGDLPGVEVEWLAVEYTSGREIPDDANVARRQADLEAALERLLRDGRRPDVAVLGREAQAWYVPEVLRARGVPVVAVAQGVPVGGFEVGIYPPQDERAFVELVRSLDLTIAVARHLEDTLRAHGVENVVTIPNAVDRAQFSPAERDPAVRARAGVPPDAPVVAHVCGLLPGKRWQDLIASAALVAAQVPHVRYVVAGAPDELASAREAARSAGVHEVFRFLGEIERDAMPALLNAADLMVHTSEREGAPFTYQEAAACGIPVVATDIAPAREAIADGATGILYPIGDVDALSAATIALLRDDERRRAMGRAARSAPHTDLHGWIDRYAGALARAACVSPVSP